MCASVLSQLFIYYILGPLIFHSFLHSVYSVYLLIVAAIPAFESRARKKQEIAAKTNTVTPD